MCIRRRSPPRCCPPSDRIPGEVLTIENERNAIARYVERVTPQQPATFVYEAVPCGYEAHRQTMPLGYPATVMAPALTPSALATVKTKRRDAEKLPGSITPAS